MCLFCEVYAAEVYDDGLFVLGVWLWQAEVFGVEFVEEVCESVFSECDVDEAWASD